MDDEWIGSDFRRKEGALTPLTSMLFNGRHGICGFLTSSMTRRRKDKDRDKDKEFVAFQQAVLPLNERFFVGKQSAFAVSSSPTTP